MPWLRADACRPCRAAFGELSRAAERTEGRAAKQAQAGAIQIMQALKLNVVIDDHRRVTRKALARVDRGVLNRIL